MPVLLLLSSDKNFCKNKKIEQQIKNDKKINNLDFLEKIEKMFRCLDCPECIKKIINKLAKFELWKLLWEPVVFRRNNVDFLAHSGNFDFRLKLKIVDPVKCLVEKSFQTYFSIYCDLIITNRSGKPISKSIRLININECSANKSSCEKFVKETRDYIKSCFGIDIFKWNVVTED